MATEGWLILLLSIYSLIGRHHWLLRSVWRYLNSTSPCHHISATLAQHHESSSDSDDSVVVGPTAIGDRNKVSDRMPPADYPGRDKMREKLEREAEWDRVRGLDRGAAEKLKPKGREVSVIIFIIHSSERFEFSKWVVVDKAFFAPC